MRNNLCALARTRVNAWGSLAIIAGLLLTSGSIINKVEAKNEQSIPTEGKAQPKKSPGTTIRSLLNALSQDKAFGLNEASLAAAGTASSGISYVPPAIGGECKTNNCYPSPGYYACATCVTLEVAIPPNSTVDAIRCYTTAWVPNDGPLRSVDCTTDIGWAVFEKPNTVDKGFAKFVVTKYHNRSGNRTRAIKMEVDYK